MDRFMQSITGAVTQTDRPRPPLGQILGQVFRSHSAREAEDVLFSGRSGRAEPKPGTWPQPWLFARVFAVLALGCLILLGCSALDSFNAPHGVLALGCLAVPLGMLLFFYELNTPRDMGLYAALKAFTAGGFASLLLTLLFSEVSGPADSPELGGALAIALGEELVRLLLIWAFLRLEKGRTRLHGLLLGVAVGAGFAALDSLGHASLVLLQDGYDTMLESFLLQTLLSPCARIAWSAITGYALMPAEAPAESATRSPLSGSFWRLGWLPPVLHGIWAIPMEFGSEIFLIPGLMTLVSLVLLFVLTEKSLAPADKPAPELLRPDPGEAVAAGGQNSLYRPDGEGGQNSLYHPD